MSSWSMNLRTQEPQQTGEKEGKHSGQKKGRAGGPTAWRPVLQPQITSDRRAQDESHASPRFAASGSYGKGGKDKSKDKSRGGKFQEWRPKGKGKSSGFGKSFDQGSSWNSKGKGNRYHAEQVAFYSTDIFGHYDEVWWQLRDAFPNQRNHNLTEFWQDNRGEWFVKQRCE